MKALYLLLLFLSCELCAHSVADEPVVFTRLLGASRACGSLLFTPSAPPRLTDYLGNALSAERDYQWASGSRTLCLTKTSRVPIFEQHHLYPPRHSLRSFGALQTDPTRGVLSDENGLFDRAQVRVSYETLEQVTDTLKWGSLPRTSAALAAHRALNVALVGDSIGVGEGAQHCPAFGEQVIRGLKEAGASEVSWVNYSLPGRVCLWAMERVPALIWQKPDLILLEFGVNDAFVGYPPEEFISCITQTIEGVRKQLPQVEFILITPLLTHPAWPSSTRRIRAYAVKERELASVGVAVADITAAWETALRRKGFWDLTSNGTNHPSDYGHSIFAQTILSLVWRKSRPGWSPSLGPFAGPVCSNRSR
jgi:acyl-CoA thioesterase I